MKKISTVRSRGSKFFKQNQLTIGLDLGDRTSHYCILNEAGEVILEQRTAQRHRKESRKFSAGFRGVGSRWKPGRIHLGSAGN